MQALTLARELRRRGHHVEFVTNRWPGLSETAVVDGFAVQRLEPGRLRKHREFRLWFNLARYVWARRRDFDILHSHGAYFTHAFIGPLARVLGLKSLVKASLANDDLLDLSRPVVGRLHRFMLRRIDACVGISQDLVEEFRAGGVSPRKIHHRAQRGGHRPASAACLPSACPRFGPAWGCPSASRSCSTWACWTRARTSCGWPSSGWPTTPSAPARCCVAVGPQSRDDPQGVLRASLAELARAHPQRFVLHDFHADVVPYYQCADLLVLPSYKEGLPNVVLEAMACSLPCVAARASGSRELIVEGETGFTYAPDDSAGLATAVQRCLSPAAAGMGDKARRLAEERYSIRAIADQYEALYRQLLPGGQAGDLPLLMITELFLPTKGGTAVMFEDDCRRLGGRVGAHRHCGRAGRCRVRSWPSQYRSPFAAQTQPVGQAGVAVHVRAAAREVASAVVCQPLRCRARGSGAARRPRRLGRGALARVQGRDLCARRGTHGLGQGLEIQDHVLRVAPCRQGPGEQRLHARHADLAHRRAPGSDRDGLPHRGCRTLSSRPAVRRPSRVHRPHAGQRLVLSVGRLQRRKGFDNVVRSLPGLVARGIDVHYAIVGIGEDWDYLKDMAQRTGRERTPAPAGACRARRPAALVQRLRPVCHAQPRHRG